jgi:hypothetical protein
MKAEDGTAFNVDQIVSVGAANTIRRSNGFPPYLMVSLTDGRFAVPLNDTNQVWPADALDAFLHLLEQGEMAQA